MGARPVAAFLSMGLPRELTVGRGRSRAWVDRFFDGFLALAGRYKTPLAGGDLAESPVAVADIVLLGAVPRGKALLRWGARPGDLLFVTGSLGGAAAGFDQLLGGPLVDRYARSRRTARGPETACAAPMAAAADRAGAWLRRRQAATAAIDLSDGLSTDLDHLCRSPGSPRRSMPRRCRFTPARRSNRHLHGGEDYELLFAARPNAAIPRSIAGVSVTRIGRFVKRSCWGSQESACSTRSGRHPLERRGWEHFS